MSTHRSRENTIPGYRYQSQTRKHKEEHSSKLDPSSKDDDDDELVQTNSSIHERIPICRRPV
ncbi:hypothetical protein DPX16_20134 [Anabarilius grahami]|uniref:Uncharacterized protein n=1 Tax=Anabarilius grahami TaxID=495550 RepID=A0A3N0XRM9_ANAGA|nr:hypothetical protein DPX16_20134 [Anabarilius grahami]